jgi:tetratricopeptide (TPR) repeat protein
MGTENLDSVEMIAELARGMMPERRTRFLDAACGDDTGLRTSVEAQLGRPYRGHDPSELTSEVAEEGRSKLESDALEVMALEAISTQEPSCIQDHAGPTEDSADDQPIHEYCDRHQVSLVARLRLFQVVCQVIDQAHRHGSIDGELNPGRIRIKTDGTVQVTRSGREFSGVATLETRRYVSPEQVIGEQITTATDLYQLGLLLYELLTGRFPYRLSSLGADEICSAICQQVPERPTLALSRPGSDLAGFPSRAPSELASLRGMSLSSLRHFLSGDLELIVLKALHKEPERRYATARDFADDIDRFLQRRPVQARDATWSYHTAKLLQRHPLLSSLTLLLVGVLLAVVSGESILLVRSRHERTQFEQSYRSARAALDELFEQVDKDRRFDAPGLASRREALLESLLRYYAGARSRPVADLRTQDDEAQAVMHVARINRLLDHPELSAWQYEDVIHRYETLIARSTDEIRYHEDLAHALDELGELLLPVENRRDQARAVLERSRSLLEARILPTADSVVHRRELIRVMGNLADLELIEHHPEKSREIRTRTAQLAKNLVSEFPDSVENQEALATAQINLGRDLVAVLQVIDEGLSEINRGIELRQTIVREHPDRVDQLYQLAIDLNVLASFYQSMGRLESAIETGERALKAFQQLEQRFPGTVSYQKGEYLTLDLLSRVRNLQGEPAAALDRACQVRAVLERLVVQHPREFVYQIDLTQCYSFIGRLLRKTGKYEEALRSFQQAVDRLESIPQLSASDQYQLAVNLASCMSLIGSSPESGSPEDQSTLSPSDRLRLQIYGKRAVNALSDAVSRESATADLLRTDNELDPLRDRPDFQKLLQESAGRAKPDSAPKDEKTVTPARPPGT